jgi:hypothetical protein
VRRLARERRAVDQRFDPKASLEATGRYLALAKRAFGRDDLALVSYHMGIGNLQNVLRRYTGGSGDHPSYTKLYFDTAPLRHASAYDLLSRFGDDSSTYFWRVLAAQDVMRLSRREPGALAHLEALERSGGPGARRLYPNGIPADNGSGQPPAYKPRLGLRFADPALHAFAPRPGALSVLLYTGAGARVISGLGPLVVPGAQGVRLQIARQYVSQRQALAFEFILNRLRAWDLIAWTRNGPQIDIVVGDDAGRLLPPPDKVADDAAR